MIRSMTAYSRREARADGVTLGWEIRSVNHRYLEPTLRLPDSLREVEPAVRELLRQRLSRGKVECTLRVGGVESAAAAVTVNPDALAALMTAVGTVAQSARALQQPLALDALDVLRWPGVTGSGDGSNEQLVAQAQALFAEALTDFIAAREREGAELASLIRQRLDGILREVERVKAAVPQIIEAQRLKLRTRIEEVVASPDPQRLEQELVMLAQRMDVAEEIDRLTTHITEVRRALKDGGNVGRRLDFLMQELNREANTLSSKSVSSETTQAAVEIKVLIEQMREQVQNIE